MPEFVYLLPPRIGSCILSGLFPFAILVSLRYKGRPHKTPRALLSSTLATACQTTLGTGCLLRIILLRFAR